MARERYENFIIDNSGNAIVGASATVYLADTGLTSAATLYTSAGGALTNPVTTDTFGKYFFYADDGLYDIKLAGAGFTTNYLYNVILLSFYSIEKVSNKGVANGYCDLGADGKVPESRLPVSGLLPAGTIIMWGGAYPPPSGWLWCDGTAYSSVTYATLFAAIGYTFGTGGAGLFKVPDFRGRCAIGSGQGDTLLGWPTNTPNTAGAIRVTGQKYGGQNWYIQGSQMPSHQHYGFGEFRGWAWPFGNYNPGGASVLGSKGGEDGDNSYYGTTWAGGADPVGTGLTQSTWNSIDKTPPCTTINYIIKY